MKLFKLAQSYTERELQKTLKSFVDCTSQQILVILANMHPDEVTTHMINHFRILIEQKEKPNQEKLFVLLLLFPPERYLSPYQTLFSNSWEHFYLDCIVEKFVDLKECFQCCLKQDGNTVQLSQLQDVLQDSLAVVATRLQEGNNGREFNTYMSFNERKNLLQQLFNDLPVGKAILKSFQDHLSASVMKNYIEESARFISSQLSTLSMTKYIDTRVKSLFIDFVMYILAQINQDCNLDILFRYSHNDTVQDLFASLTRDCHPVDLKNVHILSKSIRQPTNKNYSFPFFNVVFCTIERQIDDIEEKMKEEEECSVNSDMAQILLEKVIKELEKTKEVNTYTCKLFGYCTTVFCCG